MWTSKETIRALRGEKTFVLAEWCSRAKSRLWHLDVQLFERKGAATQCAGETLNALIAYHLQTRSEAPETYPEVADEDVKIGREAETSETAPPEVLLPSSLAPLEASGSCWLELPVALPDLRAMLLLLTQSVSIGLKKRDADAETCDYNEGLLQVSIASAIGQRCERSEQELATYREEMSITQHLESRFLGNTSHELRTPLTAVLGFSELLLEETYGPLSDGQRTAVGHIENSARNLLEIVNNLLDLLHIRTGKFTLQYHRIALAPLMQHLHEILLPLANRKKVEFNLMLPDDLGMIEADENILRHIVYHLLSSSLRATPALGKVYLRAERGPQTLQLIAEDTALHLPPEAIANMMDPFPRLENSPARGYEGWEVGLPLVRRYIDLHGGTLEIESLPESGTVFRIHLPLQRTTRSGTATEAAV